jgi:hypothetical protein
MPEKPAVITRDAARLAVFNTQPRKALGRAVCGGSRWSFVVGFVV